MKSGNLIYFFFLKKTGIIHVKHVKFSNLLLSRFDFQLYVHKHLLELVIFSNLQSNLNELEILIESGDSNPSRL